MRKRFRFSFTAALTTASMLQFSLPQIVAAETSAEMSAAAGQANTSEFKPDPSLLYGPDAGGSVEILGVTPNGNLSFPPSTLYYGVTGQSGDAGALPNVTTYEDLYGYRDQQIGQLEAGTGSFSSTGSLNAEATAIEVLKRSANTPSVSSQAFLTPSRELLGNGSSSSEFGQCMIQQVVDTQTYTYDDVKTEHCDTMAADTTPMAAQRVYSGPDQFFSYVVEAGQGYCSFAGRKIAVDAMETCSKLSILQAIPSVTNGVLAARACAGISGCVELVLNQNGATDAASMDFSIGTNVDLTSATVTPTGLMAGGFVTYQTTPIAVTNGIATAIGDVLTTKGQNQRLAIQARFSSVREPASGTAGPPASYWLGCLVRWNNAWVTGTGSSCNIGGTPADPNGVTHTAPDGWTYRRTNTQTTSIWRERLQSGGYATLVTRLVFNANTFSAWNYNTNRWQELASFPNTGLCSLQATVEATASKPNGCVNSFVSSAGHLGELCGNDIPVSPFDFLPDRGATRITIRPVCSLTIAPGGDEAFSETDMCKPFKEDPHCTYIQRTCADELPNGTCMVWENEYRCGQQVSYSTPIIREINICNSNLSCMGDDCIVNTGTNGTIDLADAASKLAAADMLLTDMDCQIDATSTNSDEDMKSCQLFKGDEQRCQKVTLGIADCCKTAEGVSLADYLKLAFSVSRLARMMEGSALANPITSAWVGLMDFAKDSFSTLARPLTETWESIIGNSGAASQGIGSLGIEAVKQTIMKNAAQWTANLFGEQAANMIFQVGGGPAISGGALNPGTIGLTGPASAIMSSVMMAYSIYTIVKLVLQIIFACNDGELDLMVRNALKSTHYVGTYCTDKVLRHCIRRKSSYCMFNSPLSRIMNEQARLQLGMSWGTAQAPNCDGITLEQFQNIDMEKIDLSEWTGMLMSTGMIDVPAMTDIEALTGEGSTLGKALDDLYTRENAIDRNINRLDGVDLDAARKDAVDDFGRGITE